MPRVPIALAVALLAALVAPTAIADSPHAGSRFRVVVVERLSQAELRDLAARGAVGLLVPGVGPTTSREQALAALVRGAATNANLGGLPAGRELLSVSHASTALEEPSIVVELPPPGRPMRNDRRYPLAVIGGSFHGLLRSSTTRIHGLVSIVDIAPTALGRRHGSLTSIGDDDPLATLTRLDRQIHANNRLKLPALIIIACALMLLTAVRARAVLPAMLAVLLTNLAIGALQITSEPATIAVLVVGMIAGGLGLARLTITDTRMLSAIVAVFGIHLLLFVVHPDWAALSPLGPTQNSRFWGIGNQLETLFLAPLIAGSLLACRLYGRTGFALFSLFALILVTDNRLGSDGGGAIVFGIALAFTGARALRLGGRGLTTLLLIAATAVLTIVSYNLRAPGPDHLRSAFTHGLSGLVAVVVNRVPLAYLPAIRSWPLVLPLGLLLLISLAVAFRTSDRTTRDLVSAALLAIAASLLVNDSAAYELTAGAAVVVTLARVRLAPVALSARVSLPLPLTPQPLHNDVGAK